MHKTCLHALHSQKIRQGSIRSTTAEGLHAHKTAQSTAATLNIDVKCARDCTSGSASTKAWGGGMSAPLSQMHVGITIAGMCRRRQNVLSSRATWHHSTKLYMHVLQHSRILWGPTCTAPPERWRQGSATPASSDSAFADVFARVGTPGLYRHCFACARTDAAPWTVDDCRGGCRVPDPYGPGRPDLFKLQTHAGTSDEGTQTSRQRATETD